MARIVHSKSPTLKRVRHVGPTLPRVEADDVAAALGGEILQETVPGGGSPPALFALRQYLLERVRSGGGRPALVGATRRQKIPLSDAEWARLEAIAGAMSRAGVRATPGQVAGALLHQTLEQITDPEAWREFLREHSEKD